MKRAFRLSPARRKFERETLRKLKAAGMNHAELARCRFLLTKGRKLPTDGLCDSLNKDAQERAGLEWVLRSLRGEPPPEFIIFNCREVPAPSYHG